MPEEWELNYCEFGDVNLIVGKNATGKTRTLNVIRGLAGLFTESDSLQWREGFYKAELQSSNKKYAYTLEYHSKKICFEELKVNGKVKLFREENGIGRIFAERLSKDIEFQIDSNQIAAYAKRDSIQHSFLNDLNKWADGVTRYNFNGGLGKEIMFVKPSGKRNSDIETKISIKDTQKAIQIFLLGEKEFANTYKRMIVEDMNFLDYSISGVGIASIEGTIEGLPEGNLSTLYVQESDLRTKTSQITMSDGMFRALSVLLQVNYAILSHRATCILVDDIGEGLDYSRSSALVKRLINKAKGSSIQLIMSTNDRFIMNSVPLEYWIILTRKGGHVRNLTYRNSKELFEGFERTGLNNFDFFSSGYYSQEL
ncbi:MAG: AAA family ATPase [Anaerolineaceae bacterium]